MKVFNHTKYQYKQNPPPRCHAELDSASDQCAKSCSTFGLSNNSMPTFSMGQPLKQFQGDSFLGAYAQGDGFCYHPNINYRISFGALKKNQFKGIDLAVVEKLKAPIEKFNSNNDLQNWAKVQAENIANTDFGGRQKETKIQRKAMLKEWSDYVLRENEAYNNAAALLILNAITKDLKEDNDKLPPTLNKGVLADCISEIDENTKSDKKYQFDFNKIYETKLRTLYFKDTKANGKTGWVIIPSAANDPINFEKNVEKLKTLSHKNWCTKSLNARPYLNNGDFHVYLENGQPKLGVRFFGNEIQEIQGAKNNGKIPISYYDKIKKHIDKNGLQLAHCAEYQMKSAQKAKDEIRTIKKDLNKAIKNNDVKVILKYFYRNIQEDENGLLTIPTFKEPSDYYSFSDIGIDENLLFTKVRMINGWAYFKNSQVTNLGNLKYIGGSAFFENSQVTNLGNLQVIGGSANFENSQVTNLGNLQEIRGSAHFIGSQITNLGNLRIIFGNTDFAGSQITNLGNLRYIGGDANFQYSPITNLGNLERIAGSAHFEYSPVTNLGQLETIGRSANFIESQITNLGKLKSIGGSAHFVNSLITNLGNLESIGGNACLAGSSITNFGNLESIGGNADLEGLSITNLGNLKSIGGNVYFKESLITSLGKLESIGGDVDFKDSLITNLGNLKSIGGNVDFKESLITSLGKLESIGGNANFSYSPVTNLGQLKTIGGNAYFHKSKIKHLGKLETICKTLDGVLQIENFGNLKTLNGRPFEPFK